MTNPINRDGYRWTVCPQCTGDGYIEQLDLAAIHALSESPPYCRVRCGCDDGLAPLGCEDCGEHLLMGEGAVCAECETAAAGGAA